MTKLIVTNLNKGPTQRGLRAERSPICASYPESDCWFWWEMVDCHHENTCTQGKKYICQKYFFFFSFFHRLNILSLLFSLDFLFFLTTTGRSNGLWTRSKNHFKYSKYDTLMALNTAVKTKQPGSRSLERNGTGRSMLG